MATSKNRDNGTELPPEKPKSSPGRKIILLLLLVATALVFGLEFLPEGDSGTKVVAPAKKQRPATQPQNQQPASPQQPAPQQPEPSPTPPTPPQYERPPATVFVSSSPSDSPEPHERTLADANPLSDTSLILEPSTPSEVPVEPPTPEATSAQTVAAAPPPAAESAPAEPVPAAVSAQDDPGSGIVLSTLQSLAQSAARPLPNVPVPVKVARHARRLFDQYDTNGDGVIDATEQRQMQGEPTTVDYNADGEITLDELAAYTADYGRHRRMRLTGSMVEEAVAELPPLYIPTAQLDAMAAAQAAAQQAVQQAQAVPVALIDETAEPVAETTEDSETGEDPNDPEKADVSDSPEQVQAAPVQAGSKRFITPQSRSADLPEWFRALDANGDGQLTVAEYAPNSEKSRLAEFARYDRNNDGVLTAQECPKK